MTLAEDREMEELKMKMRMMELENKKMLEQVSAPMQRRVIVNEERRDATPQLPETDPVQRFLNPEQNIVKTNELEKMHKVDEDFIHKRTAAGEVLKELKKIYLLGLINVIGMFCAFFFGSMGLIIVLQSLVLVITSVNAYYVIRAKKMSNYLLTKYQIAVQKSMLSLKRPPEGM
jgi:Ca2+-dependent lipid-binding protein